MRHGKEFEKFRRRQSHLVEEVIPSDVVPVYVSLQQPALTPIRSLGLPPLRLYISSLLASCVFFWIPALDANIGHRIERRCIREMRSRQQGVQETRGMV